MSSNNKPIIGITMGEPAGIGPEICGRALWNERVYEICNPVVIGDVKTIEHSLSFVKDSKDFPIVSYSLDEISNINYKFTYEMLLRRITKKEKSISNVIRIH